MQAPQQSDYHGNIRNELKPFLPSNAKTILEIGCASGVFSEHFENCEYWGVEYNPETAAQAVAKLDKVLVGSFDDVADDLPDGYFDTVLCNDVIEHMPDHDAFLQSIQSKMTVDGRLYASIPNVRYFDNLRSLIFGKDWEYGDYGILDRTHLRFFTFKSLKRTLLQQGYELEVFEGINSGLPKKWWRIGRRSLVRRLLVLLFGADSKYLQIYFVASVAKRNQS